jgi:hypothetical protein
MPGNSFFGRLAMDEQLKRQFAKQDLDASRSAVRHAEKKVATVCKALEKDGKDPEKSPKIKAFRELIKRPFRKRIDYKDDATNLIEHFYLTTERESILSDAVKVVPWTAHIASLRLLDVGDDDIIKIGPNECTVTLMLKGDYSETTPDIKNAVYLLKNGRAIFLDSAMDLLGGDQPPVETPLKPEIKFGLKQLVLDTDREQDGTMRFPMKGLPSNRRRAGQRENHCGASENCLFD